MHTLTSWLQHIESFHPQNIALGLERIEQVARTLQLTKFECPVVMVAGTNGKGSCVKFLESILSLNGNRVGAYTSPHLLAFNERIRIENNNITDELLIKAFEVIESARKDVQLTFFEFTTLAAFWLFKQANLDILILEVGLGGRLDAVNILDADISIITSIDIDHTDWLGTTREQIALEKAGILRKNQWTIIGDPKPPAVLLDYANQLESKLFQVNRDFHYKKGNHSWQFTCEDQTYSNLPMPQLPIQNAATALMALTIINRNFWSVTTGAIEKGLSTASMMGRFQAVETPYPAILDVAHNEASAKLLATKCRERGCDWVAVVGMLADKDITKTLGALTGLISCWYFGSLNVIRGASAAVLSATLEKIDNHKCYTYDCVADAFNAAGSRLTAQQKILVFGSFYTVAEVLEQLPPDVI